MRSAGVDLLCNIDFPALRKVAIPLGMGRKEVFRHNEWWIVNMWIMNTTFNSYYILLHK